MPFGKSKKLTNHNHIFEADIYPRLEMSILPNYYVECMGMADPCSSFSNHIEIQ